MISVRLPDTGVSNNYSDRSKCSVFHPRLSFKNGSRKQSDLTKDSFSNKDHNDHCRSILPPLLFLMKSNGQLQHIQSYLIS